jgi:hypothetical protein
MSSATRLVDEFLAALLPQIELNAAQFDSKIAVAVRLNLSQIHLLDTWSISLLHLELAISLIITGARVKEWQLLHRDVASGL